jgi:hypothetical protein
MSRYRTLVSLVAVVLLVGVASLFATGVIRPAPPPPRPTTRPTLDLSGTWAGTCSGTPNDFCTLTLTQTDNALDGTIMWSSLPHNLHLSGKVTGSTISFGAVGVVAFTGSLSGPTLSGTYTDISSGKTYAWSVIFSA